MVKLLISLVLVLCIARLSGTVEDTQKLQISLYYEYLCPYSTIFIVKQLFPVFDDIDNYVDMVFVPFGKAESVNNGESFICQHGPPECEGNKLQSCALHLLEGNQLKQAEFVACQMKFGNDATGRNCSEMVQINYDTLLDCYNSTLGTELQLEAEKTTNKIRKPLEFVPTIVYNNVFNEELRRRSKRHFLAVVCEELTKLNNIPPICTNEIYEVVSVVIQH